MNRLLLNLCVLSLTTTIISTVNAGTYSGGSGTEGSPYQISNTADLIELSLTSGDWDKYFTQMNDITFDSDETNVDWDNSGTSDGAGTEGLATIGNTSTHFTGTYDGNGKTISNLYISRSQDYQGLFGICEGAIVKNLGLLGVYVKTYYGDTYVGGLIGYTLSNSEVNNCYVTGQVTAHGTVGGLVGTLENSTITDCHSDATVTATGYDEAAGLVAYGRSGAISNSYATGNVSSNNDKVGGFIGYPGEVTITNCYSTGSVTGNNYVGGFGGFGNYTEIRKCYSSGNVTASATYPHGVGGFIGEVQNSMISDCYSRGSVMRSSGTGGLFGGFIGYFYGDTLQNSYSTGPVYSSAGNLWGDGDGLSANKGFSGDCRATYLDRMMNDFFDSETSGQTSDGTGNATGKTTAQMKTLSTFTDAGWDFENESANGTDNYWDLDQSGSTNDGYPFLSWQNGEDVSLPVELSFFKAENKGNNVKLTWITRSEIRNLGFILERKTDHTMDTWKTLVSFKTEKALAGQGSTSERHNYEYTDISVQPGTTYLYRLADVDYDGKVTWHNPMEVFIAGESFTFDMQPAYPNPFNPSVTLQYSVNTESHTSLQVFNLRGQQVESLIEKRHTPGAYTYHWQPQNLSTGVYIVRLQSGHQVQRQRIVYVK